MKTPTDGPTWAAILQTGVLFTGQAFGALARGLLSSAAVAAILLIALSRAVIGTILFDFGPLLVGTKPTRRAGRRLDRVTRAALLTLLLAFFLARFIGH